MRAAVIAALCLGIAACTPNIEPDSYAVGSVGQVNRAVKGTVVSARQVNIEGTQSGVGAGSGALAGGLGGSYIGGSSVRGSAIGAVGGAVAGGIAGALIEESATKQQGVEYIIEAENGAILTLVQGTDDPIAKGEKVLVLYGQRSRVVRL